VRGASGFEGTACGGSSRRSAPSWCWSPLPGIEVLADGLPVGRSDANGALRLVTRGVPLRLTLRREGWRLVDVDRVSGPLDNRHVVWLAREPP
jgi:hypothetical protein